MVVGAAHHLDVQHAGKGAVGVELGAAGDVAEDVGAALADADRAEPFRPLIGEEFLHVLHRRFPPAWAERNADQAHAFRFAASGLRAAARFRRRR